MPCFLIVGESDISEAVQFRSVLAAARALARTHQANPEWVPYYGAVYLGRDADHMNAWPHFSVDIDARGLPRVRATPEARNATPVTGVHK